MMNNDELLIAIKDMFEKNVKEVKQHTGVLVESLKGDIKAIAEGHSILNDKLDRVENKVDRLESKVDNIENRLEIVEKDVKSLKSDITVVKDYVIGVDAKLNEHEVILKRVK